MSPVRAAIARPVTVTMACVAAMLVGLVGLRYIPLQLLPEGFQSRGMTLIFPYANADPLSVERDVARPVEEALATVPWLERVSVTCAENQARFNLTFSGTVDTALAALEVKDRLERIRGDLPIEAQRYFMFRHSADRFPDMAFGALVPDELDIEGYRILENRLLPKLRRIDGVASVDTWGGLVDQQAHIELDENIVRAHRVDVGALIRRLSAENFNLPGGTVDDGGRRLFIRSEAPFESIEDVRNYPVDRQLVLGDLGRGTIKYGYRDNVTRMDGKSIVWVVIHKESGRNTVEVCRSVREAAAEIEKDPSLAGFGLLPMWDAGESIEASLSGLQESLLFGGLLAVGVLFLFLRQARATLIIAGAIPFSFLVALALLAGFGFSLNILTLAGLTLAVGMLVDNAIVVVENVVRRRELGEPAADAAAHGAGEVALAITLATLTTIVVFLPLLFIADEPIVRVMMANLAVPISFGLMASLATALLVVPLLASRLRTQTRDSDRGPLAWIRRRQVAAVDWSLGRRIETAILLTALLVGGSWFVSSRVNEVGDEGGGMRERIRVQVELDASTTLHEANDIFSIYESWLIPRKDELGADHVQVRFGRGGGSLELRLKPPGERPGEEEIRKRLKEQLPRLPGVELKFRGGGGEEDGDDDGGGEVRVALHGPDSQVLYRLAAELAERLRETGAFEEVRDGLEDGNREVQIRLDREAVQRAGLTTNQVLGAVAYQLRGSRLPDLRVGGEDVPMIISFTEPDDGEGLAWLRGTQIFSAERRSAVPLSSLGSILTGRGPQAIHRVDRKTQMTVTGITEREKVKQADRVVREVMATFTLPEGYGHEVSGDFRAFNAQFAEVIMVLLLGVAFMFLLMGVLFESFLLPVAVLPALPFAFFGGYAGLWATGTPMDVLASLGSIVLAGIIVNNAIVLVDAINRGLEEGLSQRDAVLEGLRNRFRPVLLTASTTVVGLLPMAWSPATEGVMSYHSLARAVIGGLIMGTVGTLIAVPLCWLALDDLRRAAARVLGAYWR